MNIKAKLRWIAGLPLLMAVVFGLSIFLGHRYVEKLRSLALVADSMVAGVENLHSTAHEYFDGGRTRPRQQTYATFATVLKAAAQAEPSLGRPRERLLLEEITARLAQARWSFEEFDRLNQGELNAIQQDYARDITQRFNMEMRSIGPLLHRLHRDTHLAIRDFGRWQWIAELVLILVTAAVVLALMSPVLYRVNTGIGALTRGTRQIGEGALERELDLRGNDEFAGLAREFNDMARRLSAAEAERARRTLELETANRDLEGFSYSVSHDLRAPLRAIDGFIAILTDEYRDRLDDEGKRLFGIVSDNARRMGELIDDILALSRAGRLELECMPVDMNDLVGQVWRELAGQQGERAVRFQCGELPGVSCDPRALRQVWQNLLSNALKFTRGRQPAVIEVSAELRDDFAHYTVRDNGAGFNPDYAHKLFGLFQRLHGMDEFEGTGVGLTIVKRLVEKHGGEIRGTGVLDAGASFTFSLPLQPRPHQGAGAMPGPGARSDNS